MPDNRNDPAGNGVDSRDHKVTGLDSRIPHRRVDLADMTDREHECHLSGYLSGVLAGIDVGRAQMDAELSAIQRSAHKVVQAMAKLDHWTEAQQKIRNRRNEVAARDRGQGQPGPLDSAA